MQQPPRPATPGRPLAIGAPPAGYRPYPVPAQQQQHRQLVAYSQAAQKPVHISGEKLAHSMRWALRRVRSVTPQVREQLYNAMDRVLLANRSQVQLVGDEKQKH